MKRFALTQSDVQQKLATGIATDVYIRRVLKYGDFRMKDDIKEDTRLAPTIQKSIDETIPENIRL
jgi:hypothetical protein